MAGALRGAGGAGGHAGAPSTALIRALTAAARRACPPSAPVHARSHWEFTRWTGGPPTSWYHRRCSLPQEHPELGEVKAHWGMYAAAKAVLQVGAAAPCLRGRAAVPESLEQLPAGAATQPAAERVRTAARTATAAPSRT